MYFQNRSKRAVAALLTALLLACLAGCGNVVVESVASDFTVEDGVLTAYRGKANRILIPDGVVVVNNGVFTGSDIQSLVIPASVAVINGNAFARCKKLVSVTLPETELLIGYGAFKNCENLREINLCDRTILSSRPFEGCNKLENVPVASSCVRYMSNKPSSMNVGNIRVGEDGRLAVMIRGGGGALSVSFAGGQTTLKAPFSVSVRLADGSVLPSADVRIEATSQSQVYTFFFATAERPAYLIITNTGLKDTPRIVIDGRTWDVAQDAAEV